MTARTMRPLAPVLAILAMCLALPIALSAGPAAAHSSEAASTPEAGEVLVTAPSLVEVRFDSPLLDVGAALVVRRSDGTSVVVGTPRVERQSISVDVDPAAPAGEYSVAYRVVAEDGHALESSFGYTVSGGGPAPAETSAGTSAPSDTGDTAAAAAEPTSVPTSLLVAGGLLVLLLAGAGAIALRR